MLAWVNAKTPNGNAVVLGEFFASREYDDSDGKPIVAGNGGEDTLKSIEDVLTPSLTPGYQPACTECPTSGWGTEGDPTWEAKIYQKGIGADHVVKSERAFADLTFNFRGAMRTPSRFLGMRSVIKIDAP
jgi:hypothetical protein